ncbi:HK97 family phage prohead protease [Trueperella bernardiae]|uniref:HK97 family phage prohead protease n=1 Tax=Trueperella bernardiae TaxID=59561 RepID=UPI00294A6614|nr:HK97 family phage prohead protease [Trueperella bernardiae]MDV6238646.1 HK97 family phage prohead protease [Trueperella bernardiae]
MNLEIRAARLATRLDEQLDTERTIKARAVPFDEWTELYPGVFEQFTRGALTASEQGVKLRLEHSETIGTIDSLAETDTGLEIVARISETRAGNDALTLARDGALSSMSIGFIPTKDGTEITYDDNGNTYITRRAAELIEVSLVTFPAYKSATVEEVRNRKETTTMATSTVSAQDVSELAEMRAALSEIERSVALLSTAPAAPADPLAEFRTSGEYVKALAAGNDNALRAFSASEDITTKESGTRPAWVDKTLALMDAKQTLTNLFEHSKTLPAQGMSIEYPKITANTIKVGKQKNEGATLPKGRLEVENGTGQVKTYGGYSLISRQTIDRAPASYLSTVHRAQSIQYAGAIEDATVTLFANTYKQQLAKANITTTATLANLTAETLADLLIDLVDYYADNIVYPFDGLIVSTDVFKALAKLDEMPKALQFTAAPDDKLGTLTINRPRGDIGGIAVYRAGNAATVPTGLLAGYSSQALEILEGGGAPLRLSDENVTDLTNVFSVYGYAAHIATAPDAIVPVKFAG